MVEYRRFAFEYLERWKDNNNRKPLVIRGARQVGKSFLVRMFAGKCFENIVEINFELSPDISSLFASKSPVTIIPLLEAMFKARIIPGRTVLFLDEI